MSEFDYLSVLISIVLGLGITQLLSGFSRLLEARSGATIYPPAVLWALFLLLVHVQTWWAMFGMRGFADWTFLQFALVLAQPILLYLLASLIFPSSTAEQDGKATFHRHRVWFFAIMIGLLAMSIAKDVVRTGALPAPANLAFHGGLLASAAGGLFVRDERAQWATASAAVVLILAYVILLFARLA
jgi:hypothetical protein